MDNVDAEGVVDAVHLLERCPWHAGAEPREQGSTDEENDVAVFRNVMVYLGLGPDEEYEDGYLPDDGFDDHDDSYNGRFSNHQSAPGAHDGDPRVDNAVTASAVGAVRPLRPVADPVVSFDDEDTVLDLAAVERARRSEIDQRSHVSVPTMTSAASHGAFDHGVSTRQDPVVRAVPINRSKPKTISPASFGDAKLIADDFKNSVPVIMNLQGLDRELARRLIDFASGVCYSLNGSMEKLASQVFLLIPKSAEVTDEDRRRIEERGYAN